MPGILIISGTNRADSNALRIARLLAENYRRHQIDADLFSLESLPPEMFLPESYSVKPPSVLVLQQRILDAAGLHLIVPEYNGSFPGVLKYFIDMLKFPESFEHKPVAFIGEGGMWGGLRAVEHLQMIFAYRNAHLFPQRVFITNVKTRFDADGTFIDADLAARMERQCLGFAKFAHAVKAHA